MVDFRKVRWTIVSVIFLLVSVQWTFCKPIYIGRDHENGLHQDHLVAAEGSSHHKHLSSLKAPDPTVVDSVRRRIKFRMRGRKIDQSNERNIWRSHPLNENWQGPDTQEVREVIHSLGF